MNADIRNAQIESLRSMEEMFTRSGGPVMKAVGQNLGRLADGVEYDGADLEELLIAKAWEERL